MIACRACPRLVAWREEAAANPPRRFRGQAYWARPVPGFGDPDARLAVVGLAPAAHGGNRTGRVFTGDSSGDFLFAALHRAGLANQAASVGLDDGLVLSGVFVTASVRCAPPDNRPSPAEFGRCRGFLARELSALPGLEACLALGALAWGSLLAALPGLGWRLPRPAPRFAHGAEVALDGPRPLHLLASYHVSRQNTNTGRLTAAMLDLVLARASEALRTAR